MNSLGNFKNITVPTLLGIVNNTLLEEHFPTDIIGIIEKYLNIWIDGTIYNFTEVFRSLYSETMHTTKISNTLLCIWSVYSRQLYLLKKDIKSGIYNYMKKLEIPSNQVSCVEIVDSNILVCGTSIGKLFLWDINIDSITFGECIGKIHKHYNRVNKIISISDNYIVSCSNDSTICIININSNHTLCCEVIKCLSDHTKSVTSILYMGSNRLISCSLDNTIRIWNIDCKDKDFGLCLKLVSYDTNYDIDSLYKLSDTLVCGIYNVEEFSDIILWKVNIHTLSIYQIDTYLDSFSSILCISKISEDMLLSFSEDKCFRVWDINESSDFFGRCLKSFKEYSPYCKENCKENCKESCDDCDDFNDTNIMSITKENETSIICGYDNGKVRILEIS